MKQTPAHNIVNTDLMNLIPSKARNIVKVGCMYGAMARAYREINPLTQYVRIDMDPGYAQIAAQFCDRTLTTDIEMLTIEQFDGLFPSDCWIFGDSLEHLRDPWRIIRLIRGSMLLVGIHTKCTALECANASGHRSISIRRFRLARPR